MPSSLTPTDKSGPTVDRSGLSVSDLIADWPNGEVFDAQQVLSDNPELKDNQSFILDLAYEEYCRRTERGEDVDLAEFVGRFPIVETPLLDLIDVHQVLYDNPSVLSQGVVPRWPDVGATHLDLTLLEKIGSGSFSQVYIASESGVGERRVVAKICANARHEASLLGRLEHSNIVPILSVKNDRQKNLSAICMPYMGRTTLAHAISHFKSRDFRTARSDELTEMLCEQEGQNTPDRPESGFARRSRLQEAMIDIAIQLCRGLEFAHSRSVIHGDLKPSNILLTRQGTALLMDFNLSQQLRPESQAIGGTLAYMAPEQLAILSQNNRQKDSAVSCNERTDVYSFGVLLLEMFTGSHPFTSLSQQEIPAESAQRLFKKQQANPISARDLVPGIEPAIAKIIEKCLAFDPQQRWANVVQLRTALEKADSRASRALRWLRREPKLTIGVLLGVACLVAGGTVYASLPTQAEKLVGQAQRALADGDFSQAIRELQTALSLENPPPEAKLLLGEAYFSSGAMALHDERYSDAATDLQNAQDFSFRPAETLKKLKEALLQSGKLSLSEDRLDDAVSDLERALELAPNSPEVLKPLIRAYLSTEQFDLAFEKAREWPSSDQSSARAAILALCYSEHGETTRQKTDFEKARAHFRHALDVSRETNDPNVSQTALLSNIGLCCCKLNQLDDALQPLLEAIQITSDLDSPADRIVPYILYLSTQKKLANREHRLPDMNQLETCLVDVPDYSAELFFEAACCYAVASARSKTDTILCEQYLQHCLDYCARASSIGLTMNELDAIEKLQPALANQDRWQILVENAVENRTPEYSSWLLNPLH